MGGGPVVGLKWRYLASMGSNFKPVLGRDLFPGVNNVSYTSNSCCINLEYTEGSESNLVGRWLDGY
jgi:hypothetical protein